MVTIDMRTASETVETVGKGDVHYQVDNVFGSVVDFREGPQVFLVHQQPGDVTAPHYHTVPQFQVFTGGAGRFGREAVHEPTVHYADAWTSYGPIVAGPEGIQYFTARVSSDVGANYMPESRNKKVQRSGRHFTLTLGPASTGPGRQVLTLIKAHDDGLAAYDIQLDPGEELELPPQRGAGRLMTVVDGCVEVGDQRFGQWAWGHVAPGCGVAGAAAGESGVRLLCLDYPLADETHV